MFLSREIDFKLCQIYTNIYLYKILYKNRRFKQIIFRKYATNLKMTISQRSLKKLRLRLLLFEFNNFSFKKNIIDNIIYTSVKSDKNSLQWQCSIIVTFCVCIPWQVYWTAIGGNSSYVTKISNSVNAKVSYLCWNSK